MRKNIMMVLGNVILSIAASILRYIELGTDPLVTFNAGLSNIIQLNFGTVFLITNISFVLIIYLIDSKLIKFGTLFNMLILGYLQEFFISLYSFSLTNYMRNYLLLFIGIILYCISIALIIHADEGISPYEGFVIVIAHKFNTPFSKTKILIDLILVTIGYLLGGIVGAGTIAIAIFTGPIISMLVNFMNITEENSFNV